MEVPGLDRTIRVSLASNRGDIEQALRLVAKRYKERGYDSDCAGEFRYTMHHALPGTVTFVAKEGDRVVATLSLVPDNEALGLPMESIYGEEVDRLRRGGRSLAEVTCLAEEGLNPREFIRVFSTLIRVMFQYHVTRGGDTWVITVNPRHRNYYCKVLGFVALGPCRSYSQVGDHPAEAFYLDLDLMLAAVPEKYWEVFGESLPRTVLTAPSRPAEHAQYFGARSTQADVRSILGVKDPSSSAARPGVHAGDDRSCGSWLSRRHSPIGAGC